MTRRFRFAPLILLLLCVVAGTAARASVRAWLDNTQIAPSDTVQLTLAHEGQTNSRPDLTPLKQDFDIVGSSTSSSLQIANGRVSSTVQLELSLAPKRTGQLTVPSVTWGSDKSPSLTLKVTSNGGNTNSNDATAAAGKRIFLETEVDPKSPYVQAAVHVTVRVYTAVPLSHADLEFPDTDAALVRQTGSDGVETLARNGQSYQVVTRHYLVFPQHSGHLGLEGPTLSGEIPDRTRALGMSDPFSGLMANSPFNGMFGTTKPIRLHADPIELDVQARPAGAGASYWIPARDVTLQAHWSPPQSQPHVGDPITLDLQVRADGLTAAQLPDLSTLLGVPQGLKTYPDAPSLKDTPNGNDIIGSREQSIALIAEQPGHFTIPELHLSWWDTRANQLRETVLPAQTLNVEPAPGGSPMQATAQNRQSSAQPAPSAPAATSPASTSSHPNPPGSRQSTTSALNDAPWKWISLALGLLWAGTIGGWLATHNRRRGHEPRGTQKDSNLATDRSRSGPLHSAFVTACRANDPTGARRNLLLWANAQWQGPRIGGLNALAKLLDDPRITNALQALDRACYASGPWDGKALLDAVSDLTLPDRPAPRRSDELAPLYR
jgi:hypothetical protein